MTEHFLKLNRALIFTLAFLLICSVFFINAFADEVANDVLLNEKVSEYLHLKQSNIDELPTQVSLSVNKFLYDHGYEEKLYAININYDMEDPDTADVINLSFEQIVAANQIAQIYYGNIGDPGENPEVRDDFNEIIAEIDATSSIEMLTDQLESIGVGYGFRTRMYISVYTAKLNALREDTDSAAVTEMIDNAIEALKSCTVNTDNLQYEAIFAEACEEVGIQKNQDIALEELKEIFEMLYGDDLSGNGLYNGAVEYIDEATKTVADMNERLTWTVKEALERLKPEEGKYEIEYYNSLKDRCGLADTEENTKIADLSAVIGDYDVDLRRAQGKDDLLEYIDGKEIESDGYLTELEAEYNDVGGILDGITDKDGIDLEVSKAQRRVDLYEKFVECVESIKDNKGDDADISDISSAFALDDAAIGTVEDGSLLDSVFGEAMADLEIEEYKAIYADILEIAVGEVGISDKPDVERAIVALNALSDTAKSDDRIADAADSLVELYESIAKQEIGAVLGSDGLHGVYVDKLEAKIDEFTREDIGTIIDDIAEIAYKAEAIDDILDRYDEILSSDNYPSFTETEKQGMESAVSSGCDEIVDGAVDSGAVADTTIIDLNRKVAIACLEAKRRERAEADIADVEDNVNSIASIAAAAINSETSADRIKEISDRAIFDIQKEFDVQDMIDRAEDINAEIDACEDFTEAQKQSLKAAVKNAFEDGADGVRASLDEEERIAANDAFDVRLSEIEEEKNEKAEAMAEINGSFDSVKGNIESLKGLTDEEKIGFAERLDEEYRKACEAIDSASTTEVGAVKDDALREIELIDNLSKSLEAVNNGYAEAVEDIDGLGYLTDEEKQTIKDSLGLAIDAAREALGSADDLSKVSAAKDAAKEVLENILAAAEIKNSEAKQNQLADAKETLEQEREQIGEIIDGASCLTEDGKTALEEKADKALEDAMEALESVTDTEDINRVVDDGRIAFEKQGEDIALQNALAKQAQSEAVDSDIDNKKQEIFEIIDKLPYLDESEKAEVKEEISALIDEAKKELESAQSTADIDRISTETADLLNKYLEDAENKDLERAKLLALSDINTKGQEVESVIDGFIYLDETGRGKLRNDLADHLIAADTEINSAKDIASVETLKNTYLAGVEDKLDGAFKAEDDACVGIFLPIAISLGALGAVEIAALFVLSKKRRSILSAARVFAVAMPLNIRTVPLTAWSVTLVLAAADIVMAVFIVRIAVQMMKHKPTVAVKETVAEELETIEESEFSSEFDEEIEPIDKPAASEETVRAIVKQVRKAKIKQAIINVDILEKHFEAGATVDMEALKKLAIIPVSAGCLKVLARGELHKPLKVTARNFSSAAKRKISAAGGQAIVDMVEIITYEVITAEVVDDEVIMDEVITDRVIIDEIFTDEVIADEVIADEVIADEVIADEVIADETAVI